MNCPRGHGALRWDGEDVTCITCGYVQYTDEDQTKLRYQPHERGWVVRQYVTNPDCPECNGLAGTQRLVMKAISWGRDFSGGKPGRRQGYAYETFHCRRCLIEEPANA